MKYFRLFLMLVGTGMLFAFEAQAEDAPQTEIHSDYLEMFSGDTQSTFHFSGNVEVNANDLILKSQKLTVISAKEGDSEALIGKIGRINSIVAEESVFVSQAGRTASGERAEFFPEEGRVLLTGGNPTVTDAQGTVSAGEGGYIEWFQGDNRARVVPAKQLTVTLSSLKMNKSKSEETQEEEVGDEAVNQETEAAATETEAATPTE